MVSVSATLYKSGELHVVRQFKSKFDTNLIKSYYWCFFFHLVNFFHILGLFSTFFCKSTEEKEINKNKICSN